MIRTLPEYDDGRDAIDAAGGSWDRAVEVDMPRLRAADGSVAY